VRPGAVRPDAAGALAVAGRAAVLGWAVVARAGAAALVAAAGCAVAPLPVRRLFGTATCFVARTGSTRVERAGATPFGRAVVRETPAA
jgi:hypothetical protein